MSANQILPTIFTDRHNTGLIQVHSEDWIVDEIGQQGFNEALENRVIIYIHDIWNLTQDGQWVKVSGYTLNTQAI